MTHPLCGHNHRTCLPLYTVMRGQDSTPADITGSHSLPEVKCVHAETHVPALDKYVNPLEGRPLEGVLCCCSGTLLDGHSLLVLALVPGGVHQHCLKQLGAAQGVGEGHVTPGGVQAVVKLSGPLAVDVVLALRREFAGNLSR